MTYYHSHQMSVEVDTRSARLALIDKCREERVIPEPIGVVRANDVVLDLAYAGTEHAVMFLLVTRAAMFLLVTRAVMFLRVPRAAMFLRVTRAAMFLLVTHAVAACVTGWLRPLGVLAPHRHATALAPTSLLSRPVPSPSHSIPMPHPCC